MIHCYRPLVLVVAQFSFSIHYHHKYLYRISTTKEGQQQHQHRRQDQILRVHKSRHKSRRLRVVHCCTVIINIILTIMTIIDLYSTSSTSSSSICNSSSCIGGVTAFTPSSLQLQHSRLLSYHDRDDNDDESDHLITAVIHKQRRSHQQQQLYAVSKKNSVSQRTVSTATAITDISFSQRQLPGQQPEQQQQQHLVLIGGGHAHVQVLKALHAGARPKHLIVTLIDKVASASYSGMVPGSIAGYYATEDTQLKLIPLTNYSDINFIQGTVIDIDLQRKLIYLLKGHDVENEQPISFDVMSIDIGSTSRGYLTCPGAVQYTIPTRPIDQLIYKLDVARQHEKQQKLLQLQSPITERSSIVPQQRLRELVVIGGGIAGIELSMTITSRWEQDQVPFHTCTIIDANDTLLPHENEYARHVIQTLLQSKNINVRYGCKVSTIDEHFVYTASSSLIDIESNDATSAIPVPYTHCMWSTGASAHALSQHLSSQRQLDCDDNSYWIRVHSTLQSTSHPFVFAAGDCATIINPNVPSPPKAGVYAVRSGPILIENLTRYLQSIRTIQTQNDSIDVTEKDPITTNGIRSDDHLKLIDYRPQDDFLKLLVCGDGTAIGFRFGLVLRGEWVFRLKDQIDRSFMNLFDVSGLEKPIPGDRHHINGGGRYDTQQYDTNIKPVTSVMNPNDAASLLLRTDNDVDIDQVRLILATMGNDISYRNMVVDICHETKQYICT